MRTAIQFFVLPFLIFALVLGILIPRSSAEPAFPESREALEVKARAEQLYADMTTSDGIGDWIRNNLIVQRMVHQNYQEQHGSCSGFSDRPKADPSYDRYVDMSEIGLFGIELRSWHAVCGGRIPLSRPVIVARSKADWEASERAAQLERCKKNHLPCGYMGDFRTLPKVQ